MLEKILWLTGSSIFLILGALHLFYTFFTNKFNARNKSVTDGMKNVSPVLTKETTMWNAWIGFNASHSAGAIFFGIINILLAAQYFSLLQDSVTIISLTIITVMFYSWLGKKYWFRIPFTGIVIAAGCFIIATVLICFG
jgi:hypothetical protein